MAMEMSMNLLEALEELLKSQDMWVRTVSWFGCGMAFCYEKGWLRRVPTARGGEPAQFPLVGTLLEAWELVSPDNVNNGS